MIEVIKRQIGYSWCDSETEQMLMTYMTQGQSYLKRYDPTLDFENDDYAMSLLVEYVRYALSHAIDDFKTNYGAEIMSLHHRFLLAQEKEDSENADNV